MSKRAWIVATLTLAIAGLAAAGIALFPPAPTSVRIGYAISLTGPNAPGAAQTVLPNYRFWVKELNDAGGIMLSRIGKKLPIEVIEYDDESKVDKAVELVYRLIHQDKVDLVLSPWGTGLNLAVAPLFHEAGYPQLCTTAATDQASILGKQYSNSFWFTGTTTAAARNLVEVLEKLRADGRINNTVALVNVADQLGIGLTKAAQAALSRAGFTIVYDRSYAVGTQDFSQIIGEALAAGPDAFLAFSYPPDTMAITEGARKSDFNPKVFYVAIGTAFPGFRERFGADTEGVMGTGGWNPNTPASQSYRQRHLEMSGREPDGWASPLTYISLQMLGQAIERVGRIDRAAIIKELQTGMFDTIAGKVQLEGNLYPRTWYVGQWQNGEFHGIMPAGQAGAQEVKFPKPAWHARQGSPSQ